MNLESLLPFDLDLKRRPIMASFKCAVIRAFVLFIIGVFFALVLNLLQVQRQVTVFPPEVLTSLFSSAWWVPPSCGTAAAVIGLLYPCLDKKLGEELRYKREWSSVMRCVAVFVGINHASAKIDFANNIQLSVSLAAMSIGLWWLFDRSRSGFGLGVGIAVLATFVTQLLVYNDVYRYTEPDFLFVRSWLPCVFFSGGITMGNIGRQLATIASENRHSDFLDIPDVLPAFFSVDFFNLADIDTTAQIHRQIPSCFVAAGSITLRILYDSDSDKASREKHE